MTDGEVKRYRAHINSLINSLADADALNVTDLFICWEPDTNYNIGDRRQYNNHLYRCIQAHTSLSIYPPDLVPALWVKISVEEWPEWVQPLGSQDAYNEGDKVSHNEKHWISAVNTNVWEPGVYGWNEV